MAETLTDKQPEKQVSWRDKISSDEYKQLSSSKRTVLIMMKNINMVGYIADSMRIGYIEGLFDHCDLSEIKVAINRYTRSNFKTYLRDEYITFTPHRLEVKQIILDWIDRQIAEENIVYAALKSIDPK